MTGWSPRDVGSMPVEVTPPVLGGGGGIPFCFPRVLGGSKAFVSFLFIFCEIYCLHRVLVVTRLCLERRKRRFKPRGGS